jgi:hypothetical protein
MLLIAITEAERASQSAAAAQRAVVNVTYQEARSLALLPLFLSLSLFAPRAFNRWLVFLWCVFICGEAGAAHDVSTAAYTTKRFKGKRAE